MVVARHLDEWTEEDGHVLWWIFPVTEAPWIGSPLSCGHTIELWTQDGPRPRLVSRSTIGGWPGYHTHWTPLPPVPSQPCAKKPSGTPPRRAAGARARAESLSEKVKLAAQAEIRGRIPHGRGRL
jgi:hypothetical protein